MKRATVIGGRGFVGRGLVAHLQAAGWQVEVPPRDAAFPRRGTSLGHVFYCVGMTADFARYPNDTVEAHVGLLARVLESDTFDALVYLSSTRLYDGLDAAEPAGEDTPIAVSPGHPRHLYDVTKLAGETLCAAMAPGRARVARLACVYDETDPDDGFLGQLLARVTATPAGGTIALDTSPHLSRDYVHRDDVVSALVAIAERGTRLAYNIASGTNLRNDALAALIGREAHRGLVFVHDRDAPLLPVASVARARDELGWHAVGVADRLGAWLRALPASPPRHAEGHP
jgi:nucleoside-diphosphate-sugar epimerase